MEIKSEVIKDVSSVKMSERFATVKVLMSVPFLPLVPLCICFWEAKDALYFFVELLMD